MASAPRGATGAQSMKKAIVIGASSGIGLEVAKEFSKRGYATGLAARRVDELEKLKSTLDGPAFIKAIDISKHEESIAALKELIAEMGGMDAIFICSGIGEGGDTLVWETEKKIIDVNVTGFVAMAQTAFEYFLEQKSGMLAGVSSVAALRGNRFNPAYSASKAFVSNYLEGLRLKFVNKKIPVTVTDIRPGFIDTPMTKGQKGMFWLTTAEENAAAIVNAIEKGVSLAYMPSKWKLLGLPYQMMPGFLYQKM